MKKILLSSVFLTYHSLFAATFNIVNGDVAELASAITTANTNGQADIINLATNGTYVFTTINDTVPGLPCGYRETEGPVALPAILNESIAGADPSIGEFSTKIPIKYEEKRVKIQVLTPDGKLILDKDLDNSEDGTIKLTEKGMYFLKTIIEIIAHQ